MIIHYGYENLKILNPVVTTGIFDGVHRGHVALLQCLKKRAAELGGESVVVTFHPHPRIVLAQDHQGLSFLSTMDEKTVLLESAGIDHMIIIEFTREFSLLGACDFIRKILVGKIGTKHLVIGYNHHFGKSREGDFVTIEQCAGSFGLDVERVEGFYTAGMAVSSSNIRNMLLEGSTEEANNILGYNYPISGVVTEGRKIGRTIGFPTANIEPSEQYKLVPARGVYAVEVKVGDSVYPGMLSIGSNPTVNSDPLKRFIEVNIFNFNDDIYGNIITVIFRKRLRSEMKFSDISQLASQIEIDRQEVLKFFS